MTAFLQNIKHQNEVDRARADNPLERGPPPTPATQAQVKPGLMIVGSRSEIFGVKERVRVEHMLDVMGGLLIAKSGCPPFVQEVGMEAFLPPAIKFCCWCGASVKTNGAGGPPGINHDLLKRR